MWYYINTLETVKIEDRLCVISQRKNEELALGDINKRRAEKEERIQKSLNSEDVSKYAVGIDVHLLMSNIGKDTDILHFAKEQVLIQQTRDN